LRNEEDYSYREERNEREYGLYWYSGLWHILRPILVGLTVLVLVIGIGMTVWNKVYGSFLAPVDLEDTQEYSFDINSGGQPEQGCDNLENAGLIRSKSVFKYYCDFAGMSQKIQVGSYSLKKDMTMTEIADLLTTGDGNPIVRNITLIPGETVEEFAAKLVRNGVLESSDAFLAACKTGRRSRITIISKMC
jgi:Predicted periplasmic solute-binding protein